MSDDAPWIGPDRRRRQRPDREVGDLLKPGAWPVTTAELARWTGLSRDKILGDVAARELSPTDEAIERGSKFLFPIPEALRYLRQMGVSV